jgi:hypothetical protein
MFVILYAELTFLSIPPRSSLPERNDFSSRKLPRNLPKHFNRCNGRRQLLLEIGKHEFSASKVEKYSGINLIKIYTFHSITSFYKDSNIMRGSKVEKY